MALSTEGAIRSLDAAYGSTHHADWPATLTLRLYDGNPLDGGVELDVTDYPGYASAAVTNNGTNFPAASVDGVKSSALVTACTATGDWLDAPKYAGLCDGADLLEVVEQSIDGVEIPTTGGAVQVALHFFYDEVV